MKVSIQHEAGGMKSSVSATIATRPQVGDIVRVVGSQVMQFEITSVVLNASNDDDQPPGAPIDVLCEGRLLPNV